MNSKQHTSKNITSVFRIGLLLSACLLLAACASRTVKLVEQLREDGRWVEALVTADSLLSIRPDDQKLINIRSETGYLVYKDRMKTLSRIPRFDLPSRQIVLEEAQYAVPDDPGLRKKLAAVLKTQDMVGNLVFQARKERDPIRAVGYYSQLHDYAPYI